MIDEKAQLKESPLPEPTQSSAENAKDLRKRGGQPGNTNALKHGFYSSRFRARDLQKLDLIDKPIDLSSEIELMRITIGRLLSQSQSDLSIKDTVALVNAITRATGRLGQLVRIQKSIGSNNMDDILTQVLIEFAEENNLS